MIATVRRELKLIFTSSKRLAEEWEEEKRRYREMPIAEARALVESAPNVKFTRAESPFVSKFKLSEPTQSFFDEFEEVSVTGGTGIVISRSKVARSPYERDGKSPIPFIKVGDGITLELFVKGGQSPRLYVDEDDIDEDTIMHNWYGSVWHFLLMVADER